MQSNAQPADITDLVAEWESERQRSLDSTLLAHLVLVPAWTRELAFHCGFLSPDRADTVLAEAVANGLALQSAADPIDDEPNDAVRRDLRRFWMPESARQDTRRQLIEQHGRDFLAGQAAPLGQTISRHAAADPAVPMLTRRWAELARSVGAADGLASSLRRKMWPSDAAPATANTSSAARMLLDRVTALTKADQIGEARAWIEAAAVLGATLGGELDAAVMLAMRRVELAYRQQVDQRYLARFVERADQLAAFKLLMAGPDAQWALHYLGMGGVGKTMLLRHIGYLAPRAYRSPVARVDFDHLRPDYPVQRPGQLLLALAEDLRGHFSAPEHQSAYQALHDRLLFLHEIISGEPPPFEPLANLHRPEFDETLILFDALLAALLASAEATAASGDSPPRILIVLDTCEELIKAHVDAGDSPQPHLAATFEIIERLHQRTPSLRVILAGRRLLTLGGDGWRAAVDRADESRTYLTSAKPYLRLHVVRGFDDDEARRLLDRFETPDRTLPADIRLAILATSAEPGMPGGLLADDGRPLLLPADTYRCLLAVIETPAAQAWLDGPAGAQQAGPAASRVATVTGTGTTRKTSAERVAKLLEEGALSDKHPLISLLRQFDEAVLTGEMLHMLARFSPFSLGIYGQWCADDPTLTAARIREGGVDPYVDLRIVRRVTYRPLRRLLPAVVLLRRFNADMLEPAFADRPADFPAAFRALGDLEWLEYRRDPETDAVWLEVDPNLHPRMLAYFERADAAAMADLGRQLGPPLAQALRRDKLRSHPVEYIIAALDLLPPTEGAQLWSEIEWRVPIEADWRWAQKVLHRVLGTETGRPREPLLSAMLGATRVAANAHLSPRYEPVAVWRDVVAALAQCEPPASALPLMRWLAARAALGMAAARLLAGRPPDPLDGNAIQSLLSDRAQGATWLVALSMPQRLQLDAALLAVFEAMVDVADESGDPQLPGGGIEAGLHALAQDAADAGLQAFARLLEGRAHSLQRHPSRAREAMADAAQRALAIPSEAWQRGSRWADWRAPASLVDRAALEALRARSDLLPEPHVTENPTDGLIAWLAALAGGDALATVDGERLASAALIRLLELAVPPEPLLAAIEAALASAPVPRAVCLAHRQAPHLFLTLAHAWLAIGQPARADKLLRAAEVSGTLGAADVATVAASHRGLFEIARRGRDPSQARALLSGEAALGWPDAEAWPLAALTGALPMQALPAPAPDWDDLRLHAWWRAQSAPTSEQLSLAAKLTTRAGRPPLAASAAASAESAESVEAATSLPVNSPAAQAWLSLALDACERASLDGSGWRVNDHTDQMLWALADTPATEARPGVLRQALRTLLRWQALGDSGEWPVKAMAEGRRSIAAGPGMSAITRLAKRSIGMRGAAVMALDEGELLALRLPRHAVALLRQAHAWFLDADDPIAAFQAAILWRLADLRGGAVSHGVSEAAMACRIAYDRLTASRPEDKLPSWAELQVLMAASDPVAFETVSGSAWFGWIVRLMVGEQATARGVGVEPAEQWQAALRRVELLKLGPLSAEMLPAQPLAASVAAPGARTFLESGWGILLFSVASLTGLAALLAAGYSGFRRAVLFVAPLGGAEVFSRTTVGIASYAAALTVLLLVVWAFRRLRQGVRRWVASHAEIQLDIHPAPARRRADAAASVVLRRRERQLRWMPPALRWTAPTTVEESLPWPGSALNRPYAEVACDAADSEICASLATLTKQAGPRGVVAGLTIVPELSGWPWEAWLGLAAARQSDQPLGLHFYRATVAAEATPPFRPGGIRVMVAETWARLFESAWARAKPVSIHVATGVQRRTVDNQVEVNFSMRVGASVPQLDDDEVQVLHVVGRPLMTRSGPRIQIEAGTDYARDYAKTAASRSSGDLLGAHDLRQPALLRAGRLIVLQAQPSEGFVRHAVGRNEATILRTLAAELSAGGVPAVLVLPSLPAVLAVRTIERLARTLAGWPRDRPADLAAWLAAIDPVRREVSTWLASSEPRAKGDKPLANELSELVWDITLCWHGEPRASPAA